MKCPLRQVVWISVKGTESHEQLDCLKEECAWWSKSAERCDINVLAQELWELKEATQAIEKKMPHEEQFRELTVRKGSRPLGI